MPEPDKWKADPDRMMAEYLAGKASPYSKTICGVHAYIWGVLNHDLKGIVPEADLERINEGLKAAYLYGKRMDYRLCTYFLRFNQELSKEEKNSGFAEIKASLASEVSSGLSDMSEADHRFIMEETQKEVPTK